MSLPKSYRILASCPACGMTITARRILAMRRAWEAKLRLAWVVSHGRGRLQNFSRPLDYSCPGDVRLAMSLLPMLVSQLEAAALRVRLVMTALDLQRDLPPSVGLLAQLSRPAAPMMADAQPPVMVEVPVMAEVLPVPVRASVRVVVAPRRRRRRRVPARVASVPVRAKVRMRSKVPVMVSSVVQVPVRIAVPMRLKKGENDDEKEEVERESGAFVE